MRVGLHGLLEGSHLLNLEELPAPLRVYYFLLLALDAELFLKFSLLLLQVFDLLFQLFDFFIGGLALFTLKPVDCFEETVRIFNFVLNQRPQLLEKGAQVFRLFLSFLELLIKELLAVPQ